ncbi:MAG: ATP-binding protein [Ktedonobacteraceae bacterium]
MSTAIWGEPESQSGEVHPSALLKQLLQQMMVQFAATGACIALYNESINRMEIQLHVRVRNSNTTTAVTRNGGAGSDSANPPHRHASIPLDTDPSASAIGRLKRAPQALSLGELEEVSPQKCDLFPVGTAYPSEKDLIGYVWHKNETYIMRHEEYISFFYTGPHPLQADVVPTCYLVAPIQESTFVDELSGKKKVPGILGVVILYQSVPGAVFQQKQRSEAFNFAERIALYLQNDQLRRRQRRASDYLQELQEISTAFPTSVQLATLVDKVYEFATKLVDVSSMLITFYDRDTRKIYDVFAIEHGSRVKGITERPLIASPEERPVWWQVIHEEKRKLLLEPARLEQNDYDELLTGIWGDQRGAESFLLLPMKMFNRIVGSLALTSMHLHAYQTEEIQVLETMVQIITVSIENAKLYERSRQALREAKQREELLAAMNSALQSISTVLNTTELLHKFVESAARLIQVEMSVFFQLTRDKQHLIAQAAYETTKTAPLPNDGKSIAPSTAAPLQENHNELIEKIRIPFKGEDLEHLATASFFYLDAHLAEELAKVSEEAGAIFLRETGIQKMLMIPVVFQTELLGILGVHTPQASHNFRPADIGMLLAICAQAAGALRNAQLFEEIQEAYAEQQRLDKLKDEFLVTASHELRTPLSAISGYSTLLKRQSNRISPQQILRFAGKITGAAQQLTDLVSSMTEAAKIGTVDKKLELQIGPVQLLSAVEMATNMLSVNIEQKIISQVGPELWVKGDPLRVRQVITNLLDNAAKYSPADGGIEILAGVTPLAKVALPDEQVDVDSDPNMLVVLVQVYDEGEGILPEDQQKIFEKFVRAPRSLTTPVRGSGLGLFICRRYIEAMGGRLWLQQSIPGEGSAFSFYLPYIDAPQEASTNEQNKQDEPGQQAS